MQILLIAYYFPPFNGVASKRPSYWFDRLTELGFSVDVVTAYQKTTGNPPHIHYVPSSDRSIGLIKDAGLPWRNNLKNYLEQNLADKDIVIFTGGPFLHFSLTSFVKRKHPNIKIILDFRDPFSINPRFKNSFIKTLIKKSLERSFVKYADHIITVNDYCKGLLQIGEKPVTIINNGFDERVVQVVEKASNLNDEEKLNLCYAGSLTKDRDPRQFLNTVDTMSDVACFHYVGGNLSDFWSKENCPGIFNHGPQNYENTISFLKACDVGLIFTSGEPFESTTKIFDYIGCGLHVLIISQTGLPTGSLHDITKEYGNVKWVKNDPKEIASVIDLLVKEKKSGRLEKKSGSLRFSRAAGIEPLTNILKGLIST